MMLNFIITIISHLTSAPPVAIQQLVNDLGTPEHHLASSDIKEEQLD